MTNELYYSPKALQDMDEIYAYIAVELQNPDAAMHTVKQIFDCANRLRKFSQIGALLSTIVRIESSYRFLISGKYLIFYRVAENGVYIDRVLNGKRDYLRILFDVTEDCSEESAF